jgi:hypothetical protein
MMSDASNATMVEALQLIRDGRLMDATALLQRDRRRLSPQPGHLAVLPRARATISITPPTRTIRSITTPARCGNRTRPNLKSHADQ